MSDEAMLWCLPTSEQEMTLSDSQIAKLESNSFVLCLDESLPLGYSQVTSVSADFFRHYLQIH